MLKISQSDITQIPTDYSLAKRMVFVSRVQSPEISTQNNSELFTMPIRITEAKSQGQEFQERFQSPIPIKEVPGQDQSTSSNSEVQIFDQKKYLGQSMWDIPPSNSATPLPYQQINYETSKGSPSSEFVFGVGFMSIRGSDDVPSSMNGVEISQSPSQVDKSNNNKSGSESPAPNPQKPRGDDNGVRYLLV